ncbi:response regulator transcription factor [Tuberibacillus sp. Marseille-P3662]|uniref:response regulator transcription factor n=1 Tax=Tuberibacillus sp. Marseille-P3662 TaxID=1965358 RepID=UPI000A1CEEEF|nr:response regulator transcription factor [Tuberibacillus sp. Marseille-P3662]
MRLLIVEDHRDLLNSLVQILSPEYQVDTADNGEDGLFLSMQDIYDAIVLDVMLPEMSGFEIVKDMRQKSVTTPVLFLTAKDSLNDRVNGLDFGGDDYLVKPFEIDELKARIRSLLRRSGYLTTHLTLKYKGIELNTAEKSLKVDDHQIKLTIKQYELLEYLIHNAGTILTKEQLFDRIWGFDSDTTIGIVEVFIHHLRKKLEPFGYDKDIQTIRGIGYMLNDQ